MLLPLLLVLNSAQAQEVLGDGEVLVNLAPGLSGEILLDGLPTGVMAPGVLVDVSAGDHRIQVRGDCLLGMGFVQVVPGELSRLQVELQTTGGFVEVQVVPRHAEILIDGEAAGHGPSLGTELNCGDHTVGARAPDLPELSRDIRVDLGSALSVTLDLTLPPPAPVELPPPSRQGLPVIRKGIGIGLAALGIGAIGAGAWIHRLAWVDYRETYVPGFNDCEDLACQEEMQAFRSDTITRRYYGSMVIAGFGAVSLTTAGIVGLTRDGAPVLGFTWRW